MRDRIASPTLGRASTRCCDAGSSARERTDREREVTIDAWVAALQNDIAGTGTP